MKKIRIIALINRFLCKHRIGYIFFDKIGYVYSNKLGYTYKDRYKYESLYIYRDRFGGLYIGLVWDVHLLSMDEEKDEE